MFAIELSQKGKKVAKISINPAHFTVTIAASDNIKKGCGVNSILKILENTGNKNYSFSEKIQKNRG